jgi:hypothetical protein
MPKNYLLLIACCFTISVQAQKIGSVNGSVRDTITGQPIAAATITLLQKKDASLVSFMMTSNKGYFELSAIPPGVYRLLITHVKYHNKNLDITINNDTPHIQLNNIMLDDLSRTLQEVVVSAEAPPVTLVGDTIQYNAGSFKTIPNASVEQLLKKMPGIQVEKDGTVKAQGQKVNRVLVDGKEFFGTDPKMATKNLPADAVDKVQVFDKLSNAAQLTGFDDGNSEKTINLKLKQDKKKGLFGKASAGAGTTDRYEGRFNINSFKGARQFSALGMANNTNAEGFSFNNLMNFSGEMNRMNKSSYGVASFNLNAADPVMGMSGGGNNNGIKTIWGGGLNYNNVIGNKTDLTSSYFYNHYNPHQESNIQRQYFLPDSTYFNNQHSISDNLNNSHRLNLSADIEIDSFHSLKISPSIGYQETRTNNSNKYETLTKDLQPANQGFSLNNTQGHATNFSNELLFRKKFHRKGRTFSLNVQTSFNNSENNGSLFTINQFYNRTPSPHIDTIQQQNTVTGSLTSYQARAVYTEPVFKRSLLEFSVGRSNSSSKSDKSTYDLNPHTQTFDLLNNQLTNNFENTYAYTNTGIRLRTQQKKFSLAAGINGQQTALEGKIIASTKDSLIRKTFYNLLPSMRFRYDFTRYRNLSINYAAITNQPDLSQLQPVPDISDPLNIREGNPDLQQELTHAIQVNFIAVDPFRNKNLFAFFDLQETQQKIVNADIIDSLGVKRTKPVNVNGILNMNGNINLGLPLQVIKGTVNLSSNIGYSKTKQFINTVSNTIQTSNIGPAVRFDLHPSDNIALSFGAGINYYQTNYSLQAAFNTRYFSQLYEGEVNWQLPANWYFTSSFSYTVNNQRASGFNTRVPLWNAAISKQFLRYNSGELKLHALDLLNENVGISRNSNQNYIEDSRVKNLQRFFLLSFTYSLSKNGMASSAHGNRGFHTIQR